jgi:NAD-dependent dihydropyrimidine dehydrogenase PreA subunit
MSGPVDGVAWLRDTLLRLLPHATRPGLRRVGTPGPDSPVLLTCNFTLTVRRMLDTLKGRDLWLLVADSHGINVWCAAGGGHLTHHDVIAVVRSSGIAELVSHRHLVLPQLAATGVERRIVEERTGFDVSWGPARLEELPAYLDAKMHVKRRWRRMHFPLWERLEMALMWAAPVMLIAGLVLWALTSAPIAALGAGSLGLSIFGIFAALKWLPAQGGRRWLTYAGGALFGWSLAAALTSVVATPNAHDLAWLGFANVIAMLVLSLDLAGTTPWYPSTINTTKNHFSVELDAERCTGAADCVKVCPRDVLKMKGKARKVEIAHPDACLRCGACVVQCPDDALHFRFDDGRLVAAEQVRRTRMNMLGRRSVEAS